MNLRILGLALLVGLVLPALLVLGVRQRSDATGGAAPPRVLADFSLEDQDGRLIRADDLRSKPVVVTFFFTTCTGICPVSTAHLVRLQQAIATEDVAFVSFSIDPERDGPAARRAYANRWAPQERRWHLLAPADAALEEIAASLGLDARDGTGVHTTSMILLAPGGRVHQSWSPDTPLADEVAAVYSLRHPLEGELSEGGPALFRRFGCGGCHHDVGIAPDLSTSGPRSAEEVRRDVVSPSFELATGYPDTMPSYAEVLSERQLTVLSEWISNSPPGAASARARVGDGPDTAVDPVCGMVVNVGDPTLHTSAGGTEHWFCSESCRQAYLADPAQHVK